MGYKYFQDPGHGWIKVPVTELVDLGIAEQITTYSYLSPSGKFAYLEEDMDAGTFLQAKRSRGDEFSIDNRHCNRPSSIRSYPHYSARQVTGPRINA